MRPARTTSDRCLVELLRRAPDQPDMAISLELHDDVAWEQAGSPTELLQLKHKIRSSGALTDQHDDLWSTIRVWMNCPEHGHAPDAEPSPQTILLSSRPSSSSVTPTYPLVVSQDVGQH